MAENNIYKTVRTVIATSFNINKDEITLQTSSEDIEEWDSLGHIRLILQLESTFDIKFNIIIIPKLTTVSAIIKEIKQKYGQLT